MGITLISQRGSRTSKPTRCSACDVVKTPTWKYSESTHGVVSICSSCKPDIFDRSFGKKDALDFAQLGGNFESNRSKY